MRIRTALTGAAGLAAVAVLSGAAPAMGAVAWVTDRTAQAQERRPPVRASLFQTLMILWVLEG